MARMVSPDNIEFYHILLNTLGPVAVVDRTGNYVHVNTAWCDQLGRRSETVLGRHESEFFPETRVMDAMEKNAIISGHPLPYRANGARGRQFIRYYPIRLDGDVVGCLVVPLFSSDEEANAFAATLDTHAAAATDSSARRIARGAKYSLDNIIGASEAVLRMKESIKLAARSASSVLIEGETGTGKELVAHSIHSLSDRSRHPMIKVNCAAIPLELAESELFGYEHSAFTGAKTGGKIGKFEQANNSTLFLDEINQLSTIIQPKLLRVLQEKEVERVGGTTSIMLNVRLIAASNIPAGQLIEEGLLRKDLFYRLNVINVRIPPLRERLDDLPLLVNGIIDRLNPQLGTTVEGVDDEVLERFATYDWRGNVRELQNVMERGMNAKPTGLLGWDHFREYFETTRPLSSHTPSGSESTSAKTSFRTMKKQAEKVLITDALAKFQGNKKRTAEYLGLSRTMLYRKLQEYGIEYEVD